MDDLAAAFDRWPGWGDQLIGVPVGAIAAVPLRAGSVTIGSLDAYRRHPHSWTPDELGGITRAARVLALAFATLPDGVDDPGDGPGPGPGERFGVLPVAAAEVAQATGMVMGALGVSADEALTRLRGAAFGQDRLITALAADLITHRLSADLGDQPRPAPHR